MSKDLIVSFTGKVKRKHLTQFDYINELGMTIDTFVNYEFSLAQKFIKNGNRLIQSKKGFFQRLISASSHLKKNKKRIHHVQLFSSGRFNFVYITLAKIYGLPILLVERGGLNQYIKPGAQDKLTQFSSWLLYKTADYTWYKEHYMLSYLKQYGCNEISFIPNSIDKIEDSKIERLYLDRKTDYLWVNGIIPMRHVDWVVKLAKEPEFKNKSFEIYGFLEREYSQNKMQELNTTKSNNVELHPYQENVLEVMGNAKFFMLPADYVFGNFSLLENMARGVVPIISNVKGSNKIVQNNLNGLLHDNNYEDFKAAMLNTLSINEVTWTRLSLGAKQKVQNEFSLSSFQIKLYDLYKKINPLPNEN